MTKSKTKFALSVASAAVAMSIAGQAVATTATTGTTVTVTGTDSTAGDVNAAVTAVTGNDVTISVSNGATIAQPDGQIQPAQQGAVTVNNRGTLGTASQQVGVAYFGTPTSGTNTFSLDNSGVITGGVFINGVGGPVNVNSTGTIGNGLFVLNSADDITISTGAVNSTNAFAVVANGAGDVTIAVNGVAGAAATETTASALRNVSAFSAKSTATSTAPTPTTVDGVTTITNSNTSNSAAGGTAAVTIAEAASTGTVNVNGHAGASLKVDGSIGAEDQFANANVTSRVDFAVTSSESKSISSAAGSSFEAKSDFATGGGSAAIDIAETGLVTGNVSSVGRTSSDVTINGTVGREGNNSTVTARAFGTQGTNQSSSSSVTATGDSSSQNASTNARNGGNAKVAIGETATVFASVTVRADGDATIDNKGKVVSSLSASARENVANKTSSNASTAKFTSDATSRVEKFTNNSASTNGIVGGEASIANAQGATASFASASGFEGATVTNAGTIATGASASSAGSDSSNSSESTRTRTFDTSGATPFLAKDESVTASNSSSVSTGGRAALTNAPAGKIGSGNGNSVSLNGFAGASMTNAGQINANVSVNSNGSAFASESDNSTVTTFNSSGVIQTRSSNSTGSNANTASGGSATLSNAQGALIGLTDDAPVTVSLFANGDASVTNAGRINGSITVTADATDGMSSNSSTGQFTLVAATGVATSTDTFTSANSNSTAGGSASLINGQSGLIVGSVNLNGDTAATMSNSGVVTGRTTANSTSGSSTFQSTQTTTTVFTPGADGGTKTDFASSQNSTSVNDGGDVTGTYAGFNGAVQFTNTGSSDGSVSQFADGNSTATVSGTIFGNFTGQATGKDSTLARTDKSLLISDANGDITANSSESTNASSSKRSGGNSTLAVTGGTITSNVGLFADGNASAALGNGAELGGSLDVQGSVFGGDSSSTFISKFVGTYVDGVQTGFTLVETNNSTNSNGAGKGSVAIGDADIGGSVFVSGRKGGATFDLAAAGTINGVVTVSSSGADNQNSNTNTETLADGKTVSDFVFDNKSTANGGSSLANVAGIVGSDLSVSSNAGNATAMLTGQIGDDIFVTARGGSSTSSGVNHSDADGIVNTARSTFTRTGGMATLTVDAASLDVPANFGDIVVNGVGGSSVTVNAKSAVLAGGTSTFLGVGGNNVNSTTTSEFRDPTVGLSSSKTVVTSTAVGGPAVLNNLGTIGFDNGDDSGSLAFVLVDSIGGATANNSGKIFGDLDVGALAQNVTTTTTQVNLDDVTRVDTTVTDYTAVGGAAVINNQGLITESAQLAGATGTLTNTGTIGGSIFAGQSVDNYTTTSVNTLTQLGEQQVTATRDALFAQTYTINQNGDVLGNIVIDGAFGNFSLAQGVTSSAKLNADRQPLTSAITATVNLNDESVTAGGIFAEHDVKTGERFTATTVNIASTAELGGGIRGVATVNKRGTGIFTLSGPSYVPATDVDPATWTLDLGQFEILTGEVQLATNDGDTFGIRGNVTNSASLVLGTREMLVPTLFGSNLTSTGTQTVAGVDIFQQGNFVQTASGSLTIGVLPSLVRVVDPAIGVTAQSNEPLGVQDVRFSQGLFTTPENAFGSSFAALYAPSSWRIDGDLNLAGTVNVLTPKGGLFVDGQTLDLFSVSGAVTNTAKVTTTTTNNFVSFELVGRTQDGRKIVAVVADRKGYETVANTSNGAAAGAALSAALPDVVGDLTADAAGTARFASVSEFALTQDLATVMAGFDSQLSTAQAARALNELGGGSYYGSLTTIRTTAPFVDVLSNRRLPEDAEGFDFWIQPTGEFVRTSGDAATGAAKLRSNTYGGSAGFGVANGNGEFGLGFGYGRTNTNARDGLASADADTWMVGAYARQTFGQLTVAADLVFGWSNWDAERLLPTLSRQATASFDSKETRGDLRVEYAFDVGNFTLSPFGQMELRKFKFDGFSEQGAGSVGLAVAGASQTVFTPTIGVKIGGDFDTDLATIRPEASISYSFQGNNDAERSVAFLGAPDRSFRLQGVNPDGFVKVQAGLSADIGTRSGVFVRGSYSTGGGNNAAELRTGVVIGF